MVQESGALGWLRQRSRNLSSEVSRFAYLRQSTLLQSHASEKRKIVAFSLYGEASRYIDGALLNIDTYAEFFPEFRCRFYVPADFPLSLRHKLEARDAEIFIMSGRGSNDFFKFWRFHAAEDKRLDTFLIRDVDSCASSRERCLYEEFLGSQARFWIVRDHYSHNSRIMAGMWGGRLDHLPMAQLIRRHAWRFANVWSRDQQFLAAVVYPMIRSDVLIHDLLHRYKDEQPVISRVDDATWAFMGEIATSLETQQNWRQEFRRLHEAHIAASLKVRNLPEPNGEGPIYEH